MVSYKGKGKNGSLPFVTYYGGAAEDYSSPQSFYCDHFIILNRKTFHLRVVGCRRGIRTALQKGTYLNFACYSVTNNSAPKELIFTANRREKSF